jgi:Zn-dependent protease with chaperone function
MFLAHVFTYVLAAIGGMFAGSIVALIPLRRCDPAAHWTERARRSYSAQFFIAQSVLVLAGLAIWQSCANEEATGIASFVLLGNATLIGGFAGGLPALRKALDRPVSAGDIARGVLVSLCVRMPGIAIFCVMMLALISRRLDWVSASIMGSAFALVVASLWGAWHFAKAIGLIVPVTPRLQRIVEEAASRAGCPAPPAGIIRWHPANALAFPFAQTIAFTPSIIELLSDEELIAVGMHEIAHLNESVGHRLTRLSWLLVAFPFFTFPVWFETFGVAGLFIPVFIYLVGARLLRAFSQKMERRADAHASAQEGDEGAYARALEKLYEFNRVPAVMPGKGRTHPHLYDRLVAAGCPPDYPRPRPPSVWIAWLSVALAAGIALAVQRLAWLAIGAGMDRLAGM